MIFWLFICILLFAIGDILGAATKAKLSSVFVAMILFLIGFLTGILPPDIITLAGIKDLSGVAISLLVYGIGTSINIKQLLREWRVCVMAFVAMAVAILSCIIVMPILGKENVLVAAPIVNGGVIATQIMTEAAMEKGFALAASLGAIVYAVQKFVGTPFASAFGLREARKAVAEYHSDLEKGQLRPEFQKLGQEDVADADGKTAFWKKYERFYTDFVCIAITAGFGCLATWLGKNTPVNYSIWALALGIVTGSTGLVPPNTLNKGKASGFMNIVVFGSIIPSMATITLADLTTLAWQTGLVFVAVLIGIFLFVYILPLWKIVGHRDLAVGVSVVQLLGFPANYLVVNEVAAAVAETPEEKQVVLNRLMPAYIIANFASVTTISIVIAGAFVKML